MELNKLEKSIGYNFKDKNLLRKALTHTSYAYEKKFQSNEKLEFLGDAILDFVISKYLYKNHTRLREGEMTKVRAHVVCEQSLYEVAIKHNFSDFLYLGRSEKANGGNMKKTILADSVEAIIAAIYLDGGLEIAEKFIIDSLIENITVASKNVGEKDYKTVLQEKLQVNGDVKIEYSVIKEAGPDHDKIFTVKLECEGEELAIGEGSSKKNAEMQAAKKALEKLK